jgi:uncharacterized protein (DUF302 family)
MISLKLPDMNENGMITIESDFPTQETADRVAALAAEKGFTISARVKLSENVAAAGMQIRPTEAVLFSNIKAGGALAADRQTMLMDLPLRVVAWEDESGKSRLTWNDLPWLAKRHELPAKVDSLVASLAESCDEICHAAATKKLEE